MRIEQNTKITTFFVVVNAVDQHPVWSFTRSHRILWIEYGGVMQVVWWINSKCDLIEFSKWFTCATDFAYGLFGMISFKKYQQNDIAKIILAK